MPEPVPVFDLHSDILLRAISNGVDIGEAPEWTQVNLKTMEAGHVENQVFAVWVDSYGVTGLNATRRALEMIDIFQAQAEKYKDRMALATTMAEADAITDSGRVAVWLWLEGGAPIADDLALLRTFYRLGVRGMTLTWMNNLLWAGAATDKDDPDMGLTELGREVVAEMNRLGMVVDVSHVSEATFYDALELSTDPVVASHSCCRALADHPRNLSDDQLRALAKNGGVIGIAAMPSYLSTDFDAAWEEAEARVADQIAALKAEYDGNTGNPLYRDARRILIQNEIDEERSVTLGTYLDHIEHAIEVAGYEHVGLGSDFDGIWAFPIGLEKASKWQSVAAGLRDRGHSEEVVAAVMHGNVARVFRQVMDR
ncbi:MAG: dipeptidase [Sumerlaeia bacterium]